MTIETWKILDATEPEKIFSKDDIAKEYKAMAKRFHPDNYVSGSHILFTKINELHTAGLRKIQNGTWDNHELLLTSNASGRSFKFNYDFEETTEYGKRFASSAYILCVTDRDSFPDTFEHNVCQCQDYLKRYPKMQTNFMNLIPLLHRTYNGFVSKYGTVIVLKRPTPAFHSVQSVLDTNKIIPHKQATWIISRLMNLCVLLNKSGMTHNGITLNSVYINVLEHTAALMDGWWYSSKKGTKVKSVPTENVGLLSKSEREDKLTTAKFDLECVKQIGRKLEYDETPRQIKQWLKMPSSNNVLAELEHWQDSIIIAAYGEHKFNKWEEYKVPK